MPQDTDVARGVSEQSQPTESRTAGDSETVGYRNTLQVRAGGTVRPTTH